MSARVLLNLLLILAVAAGSACRRSSPNSGSILTRPAAARTASETSSKQSFDKEFEAYQKQILERFLNQDFSWIDQEARKVRTGKERLPGGYWKIRAIYAAIEEPAAEQPSDRDWDNLFKALSSWSKEQPDSVTARVALASAWKNYAWEARGDGPAATVTAAHWKLFGSRLAKASEVLLPASSLREKCPYWFVVALWVALGADGPREALDRIYEAGIRLEPHFYYLHQTKATYLLPRWRGSAGEMERFADEAALKIGGDEGDVVFFAIYSSMVSLAGDAFMYSHEQAVPRLIAGFRAIEKLYGASSQRLNEAALFASYGNDVSFTTEVFARIGNEFDESVWRSQQNFEFFHRRQQQREKASQNVRAILQAEQKTSLKR